MQCKFAEQGMQCHKEEEGLDGEGSCELPAYCEYPLYNRAIAVLLSLERNSLSHSGKGRQWLPQRGQKNLLLIHILTCTLPCTAKRLEAKSELATFNKAR